MIDPMDFLLQAEAGVVIDEEVARRTAVSRGYYVAFHEARRLLVKLGVPVPQRSFSMPNDVFRSPGPIPGPPRAPSGYTGQATWST
jgi:hypothetical protein